MSKLVRLQHRVLALDQIAPGEVIDLSNVWRYTINWSALSGAGRYVVNGVDLAKLSQGAGDPRTISVGGLVWQGRPIMVGGQLLFGATNVGSGISGVLVLEIIQNDEATKDARQPVAGRW